MFPAPDPVPLPVVPLPVVPLPPLGVVVLPLPVAPLSVAPLLVVPSPVLPVVPFPVVPFGFELFGLPWLALLPLPVEPVPICPWPVCWLPIWPWLPFLLIGRFGIRFPVYLLRCRFPAVFVRHWMSRRTCRAWPIAATPDIAHAAANTMRDRLIVKFVSS